LLYDIHHPPTTELYTLSLHDALPISTTGSSQDPASRASTRISVTRCSMSRAGRTSLRSAVDACGACSSPVVRSIRMRGLEQAPRSEEHTSELQSRENLVCRLLLEKKK